MPETQAGPTPMGATPRSTLAKIRAKEKTAMIKTTMNQQSKTASVEPPDEPDREPNLDPELPGPRHPDQDFPEPGDPTTPPPLVDPPPSEPRPKPVSPESPTML